MVKGKIKEPKLYSTYEKSVLQSIYDKVEKWLIALACLSFFPLIYLLGKAVTKWLN